MGTWETLTAACPSGPCVPQHDPIAAQWQQWSWRANPCPERYQLILLGCGKSNNELAGKTRSHCIYSFKPAK